MQKPIVCGCCKDAVKENRMGEEQFEVYPGGARSSKLDVRYDLIPLPGLKRVALTCAEGAEKYGVDNWKKGIPTEVNINHALNHIYLFLEGNTDEDHLAHAAWRLLAAMSLEESSSDAPLM